MAARPVFENLFDDHNIMVISYPEIFAFGYGVSVLILKLHTQFANIYNVVFQFVLSTVRKFKSDNTYDDEKKARDPKKTNWFRKQKHSHNGCSHGTDTDPNHIGCSEWQCFYRNSKQENTRKFSCNSKHERY